jgi:hypothetical protein
VLANDGFLLNSLCAVRTFFRLFSAWIYFGSGGFGLPLNDQSMNYRNRSEHGPYIKKLPKDLPLDLATKAGMRAIATERPINK